MRWVGTSALRTHAWLLTVVPADARRFRVDDTELAATLRAAGAVIVDRDPDVEIATRVPDRATAPTTLVSVNAMQPEGGHVLTRAARRSIASVYARVCARWCRSALRRRGYERTTTVMWDLDQQYRFHGSRVRTRSARDHLPQCAIVIAEREGPSETLLDAALVAAGQTVGDTLDIDVALAQEGATVVLTTRHVLRATIGPASHKLELERSLLEALHEARPSETVASRAPRVLASGRTGLAQWCVETRVPGSTVPAAQLNGRLRDDCVDFLVELFEVKNKTIPEWTFRAQAELVAAACADHGLRSTAVDIASWLTDMLGELPRGFGHGDFWQKNLLAHGGALTGVVDWDTADASALPYLDLLHLRMSARRARTRQYLGTAVVDELLPWARRGGDALNRSYGERIDVPVDAGTLEALVVAYWLNQVARRYAIYGNGVERPVWTQHNVRRVLEEFRTMDRVGRTWSSTARLTASDGSSRTEDHA